MAFHGVVHAADETGGIEQRKQVIGFLRRDQFGIQVQVAADRMGGFQPVHAIGRVGQYDAAGQVDAAGLAGDFLDLPVQLDRVALERGDVGIAVQRVHAAGGMPGRAAGQL